MSAKDGRIGAPPEHVIIVSREMTTLLGAAAGADVPVPDRPVALTIELPDLPKLTVDFEPNLTIPRSPSTITMLVARSAVERLFATLPSMAGRSSYHLPGELRAIALELRDCPLRGDARTAYRLAKSIEFLCEAMRHLSDGELVPLAGCGLTFADTRQLIAARNYIEQHWSEPLTLSRVARACGLNRAKLTRGFRDMFDCTVTEAIAERRLEEARRMLVATDLPVSSVGYKSGYLNNASFARAFGRRFGMPPSMFRAGGMPS